MNAQFCVRCGGKLNVEKGEIRCAECGSAWTEDSARLAYEAFKATVASGTKTAIDEAFVRERESKIAALRRRLWQEIHTEEPSIDCGKVTELAGKILELDPKAVDAGFYVLAGRDQWKKVNKYLNALDAQKHKRYVEDFIDFLTRPYVGTCLLYMNDLLDRAFSENSKEYLRCHDKIAKSASDDFNPSLSRSAFVAYSSEDKEKAYELVEALEERGLKCFISMRNSKKGRNANIYYEKDLQTAMDHCLVFVFVSTKNSRSEGCKARDEIEYILRGDIFALQNREQQNYYMNKYGLLSVKDKKPRVEWLVNEYPKPIKDAYEKDVNEFFDGFSRYGDMKTVVEKVEELTRLRPIGDRKPEGDKPTLKYCVSCGSDNPTKAKRCMECGYDKFVATYAEYENILLRKRIEELEAGARKPVPAEKPAPTEKKSSTATAKTEEKTAVSQQELSAEEAFTKAKTHTEKGEHEIAAKWYLKAAEQGHAEAQCELAVCYRNGRGVEKSYPEMVKWFKIAAEQGYVKGQYNLAVCYKNGRGVAQSYGKMAELYRQAAEQGFARAQFQLGKCYEYGRGTKKDIGIALEWYGKAAAQGYKKAIETCKTLQTEEKPAIGEEKGLSAALERTKKSLAEETKAAETAGETSYADAIARMQGSFLQASKTPETPTKPTETEGYANAIARARVSLGTEQKTSAPDEEAAYTAAISRAKKSLEGQPAEPAASSPTADFADEIQRVGRILQEKPTVTAITPPKTAATAVAPKKTTAATVTPAVSKTKKPKDAQELYRKGKNFEYGLGGKKDYAKALECYKQAAEQGHSRATYEVGMMYFMGVDIARSYREAVKWFEKAIQLGDGDATYWLACCYHIGGNGITQDFEKAVYWYERAVKECVLRREARQGLRRAKKGKPYA